MQKERNNIMKNIHQIINDEETSRIMQSVEEIETYKNDSNRMYQAVRILQKKQTKNGIWLLGNSRQERYK